MSIYAFLMKGSILEPVGIMEHSACFLLLISLKRVEINNPIWNITKLYEVVQNKIYAKRDNVYSKQTVH